MPIDVALREELEKRGMFEKIRELEGLAPKTLESAKKETEEIRKRISPVSALIEIPKRIYQRLKLPTPETPEEGEIAGRKVYVDPLGAVSALRTVGREVSRQVGKKVIQEATKRLPKISDELLELKTYFKNISAPQKLTIEEAKETGIALRTTKGGKLVPAVRQAGPFVPEEFANYKNFKDVKQGIFGGTKDITRAIQEVDGVLPAITKAKLPGQAGPAEKFVLWRVRDMIKMKMSWLAQQETKLKEVISGISDEAAITANRILEKLSRKASYVKPEKLLKEPEIAAITKDIKLIEFAQNARKHFEHLLKLQNVFRKLRNQSIIPYRKYYSPHELQKTSLWERSFGLKKEPIDIIRKPELPDYIKPNKPFNPRELARESGLPEFAREMNLKKLLQNYTQTAAKDIFDTSIVQNNKAFVQQLETMGFPNSARLIQDWTAEAFAGVRAVVDRAAALGPTINRGMNRWRQALVKGVFPLNFAWNTFVQTSSGILTVAKYGAKNSMKGAVDWFTNSATRKAIEKNTYSYIIKTAKPGKITRQDVNKGMTKAVQLEKSKFDTMVDAFNYFTEWTEKHLTGWSVASARHSGIEKGLKGKSLWEFASDGGAKTQSMYNLEDLPGILRAELTRTIAPFQTFSFEIFNTMREWAGRTGIPPATTRERIGWMLRFLAGITAVNYIGNAAIGRKPWQASSFIPFYGTFFAPIVAGLKGEDIGTISTRGLPSPVAILYQFGQGINKYIVKGDIAKLRTTSIRYLPGLAGIPGGTQMARIVDGIIAIANQGVYDSAGRMKFPIYDTKDQMRAIFSGPWSTKGGQEYWQKREKKWLDLLERFKEYELELEGELDFSDIDMGEELELEKKELDFSDIKL